MDEVSNITSEIDDLVKLMDFKIEEEALFLLHPMEEEELSSLKLVDLSLDGIQRLKRHRNELQSKNFSITFNPKISHPNISTNTHFEYFISRQIVA